jgi:hypothetical protein
MPFVITNRKAGNGFTFGDVPGDRIFYGTVSPKGSAAGFAPIGQGTGAQAETELFKTLKSRLLQNARNVVFFVNGSGQDFDHVARIGAALEAEYGVEVVLLCWPSAENNRHKYENHYTYVRDATPIFLGILTRWLDVAGTDIPAQSSRQILFFHSLGNQAVEIASQDLNFEAAMKKFQPVLINAADVDAGTHAGWLFRLGPRAYVVQNGNDKVLDTAEGGFPGSLFLGKNPMKGKKRLGKTVDLAGRAPHATYIDVTTSGDAGKQHEYYIELDPKGNLKALYSKLLAEKQGAIDLSGIAVRDAKSANLWRLK